MQITIQNITHVAEWMRDRGGAVAGMKVRSMGELGQRGVWFGTLTGGVLHAGIGDWVVRGELGEFERYSDVEFRARLGGAGAPGTGTSVSR